MQHEIFRSDRELAENIMTLTGTVISRMVKDGKGEQVPEFISWPSKVEDGFLDYLLNGGKFKIYSCDEYKQCLNVTLIEKTIERKKSWIGKINGIIDRVQKKIIEDKEGLNGEEKELMTRIDCPIWRIISVLTAYQGNNAPISIWGISDIVATDLLIMYIKDCISFLREGAETYRMKKIYCDQVDRFIDNLKYVEKTIQGYELKNSDRLSRRLELIEKIDMIEESLMREIKF